MGSSGRICVRRIREIPRRCSPKFRQISRVGIDTVAQTLWTCCRDSSHSCGRIFRYGSLRLQFFSRSCDIRIKNPHPLSPFRPWLPMIIAQFAQSRPRPKSHEDPRGRVLACHFGLPGGDSCARGRRPDRQTLELPRQRLVRAEPCALGRELRWPAPVAHRSARPAQARRLWRPHASAAVVQRRLLRLRRRAGKRRHQATSHQRCVVWSRCTSAF